MRFSLKNNFAPRRWLYAFGVIAALAVVLVLYSWAEAPLARDPSPLDVTGCYWDPTAPDIIITRSELVIQQDPQIKMPYRLEYRDEWGIVVDRKLEFIPKLDGKGRIVQIADGGMFLSLAPEGLDPQLLGLDLASRGESLWVRYVREGQYCPPAQDASSSSFPKERT